jgi:hypothetical protein
MVFLLCALCLSDAPLPGMTDQGEVVLHLDGRELHPLAGLGPILEVDGQRLRPSEYTSRVLERADHDGTLRAHLVARAAGAEVAYEVAAAWDGAELRFTVTSESPLVRGLSPGALTGAGRWQRYDLSRYQEAYGQHWWPRTNYLPEFDLFLSAGWRLDDSNGSEWGEVDPAVTGDAPLPLAPEVRYTARTDGSYAPLRETLVLRLGSTLAEALPLPAQKPSPYREELSRMVYVDLWGGTAAECSHLLEVLREATAGRQRFLTVLQPWESGGWDALLPDSMRLPDYPPDPGVGSTGELQSLAKLGRSMGRMAFRTNYMLARDLSPSIREGLAHHALNPDGSPKWHTAPSDWPGLIERQERAIQGLFGTNAGFSDQLTSGAWPGSWLDFNAATGPLAGTLGETLRAERDATRRIRTIEDGPLGSESAMDQHLLGEFVDYGDFGIMDGYHRAPCPEYYLRVMRNWSGFHGMGLWYRFVENAPYPEFHAGKCRFWEDRAEQDDYRCMEVLYGNGGYLCWMPGVPWTWTLAEALLVGTLQQHWAAVPVTEVGYLDATEWKTLEDLIREGATYPIGPGSTPPAWLRRVRVTYGNGLRVVTNRSDEELPVEAPAGRIVLPRSGWVAWKPDGSLLAYSALDPTTGTRVDRIDDRAADIRYLDPRGQLVDGVTTPTMWRGAERWLTLDEARGVLTIQGRAVALALPEPPPLTTLACEFGQGLGGWRPLAGILRMAAVEGAMRLHSVTDDPQTLSPSLRLSGDANPVVTIRIRTSAGEFGQLYWATEAAPGISQERCAQFPLHAGVGYEDVRIDLSGNPAWMGQTITRFRLDPVHGVPEADVDIESIRGGR